MPWTTIAIENHTRKLAKDPGEGDERLLTYAQALREAQQQALRRDRRVFIAGEGVDDPGGIFGSTLGLHKEFTGRVFDIPLAEAAVTGIMTGAALAGLRPVLAHMRLDFTLLSFDQILNHAAKARYMSGGRSRVPLVIRALIGQGWGSAAQHSQSFYPLFMHMPGLKVALPSNAYDAKGLLLAAIADDDPVMFIEHRWLYDLKSVVPEKEYLIPFGKGVVRRRGADVTILALSLMVPEALKASEELLREGIRAEVIDPRTLVPFDEGIVLKSVAKTGRLVIADSSWRGGSAAEILLGRLCNPLRPLLKKDAVCVTLPDSPTPASPFLEKRFYKDSADIKDAVRKVL
ncbi:MAG: transketolase C-terminal domain-containing protein [Candidatus Omnitrophota bacterium]